MSHNEKKRIEESDSAQSTKQGNKNVDWDYREAFWQTDVDVEEGEKE